MMKRLLLALLLVLMLSNYLPRNSGFIGASTAKRTATYTITVPDINGVPVDFVYPLGKLPRRPKMNTLWKIPNWFPKQRQELNI